MHVSHSLSTLICLMGMAMKDTFSETFPVKKAALREENPVVTVTDSLPMSRPQDRYRWKLPWVFDGTGWMMLQYQQTQLSGFVLEAGSFYDQRPAPVAGLCLF